jgi:hypothetical protein
LVHISKNNGSFFNTDHNKRDKGIAKKEHKAERNINLCNLHKTLRSRKMFYEEDERPATGRRREDEGNNQNQINGNASPRPSTASRDARANRASQLASKRKERSSIGMQT